MPRSARITTSGLKRENDPLLLVLMSLASSPKHGHALIADIEEFAQVHLGPGTLYGAITHLEEQGLIAPLPSEGRRRPYRITDAGTISLSQVLDAMDEVVRMGRARLPKRRPGRQIGLEPG